MVSPGHCPAVIDCHPLTALFKCQPQEAKLNMLNLMQMGVMADPSRTSKPVLSPLLWDRLESTPYGRNMDRNGNYIVKPVDEQMAELQKSSILMDHYRFTRDRQVAMLLVGPSVFDFSYTPCCSQL